MIYIILIAIVVILISYMIIKPHKIENFYEPTTSVNNIQIYMNNSIKSITPKVTKDDLIGTISLSSMTNNDGSLRKTISDGTYRDTVLTFINNIDKINTQNAGNKNWSSNWKNFVINPDLKDFLRNLLYTNKTIFWFYTEDPTTTTTTNSIKPINISNFNMNDRQKIIPKIKFIVLAFIDLAPFVPKITPLNYDINF